jgi:RNA polymerase sigma-70 factor, ECF subfamily
MLADQTGSPVVQMNRAIAIAEIDGPTAGLAILDRLDLDRYRYFRSTRAELLRRAGRDDEARRVSNAPSNSPKPGPERRFLTEPDIEPHATSITLTRISHPACRAVATHGLPPESARE